MTDKEVMQMALDALIETVHLAGEYGTHLIRSDKDAGHAYKTIETLRAALAQPEPEPVAWMYVNTDGECEQIEYGDVFDDPSVTPLYAAPPQRKWVAWADKRDVEREGHDFWVSRQQPAKDGVPLYTATREWVGLTEEDWIIGKRSADYIAGAEWAEDKLKEKNNG